jgi:hypothetical protein
MIGAAVQLWCLRCVRLKQAPQDTRQGVRGDPLSADYWSMRRHTAGMCVRHGRSRTCAVDGHVAPGRLSVVLQNALRRGATRGRSGGVAAGRTFRRGAGGCPADGAPSRSNVFTAEATLTSLEVRGDGRRLLVLRGAALAAVTLPPFGSAQTARIAPAATVVTLVDIAHQQAHEPALPWPGRSRTPSSITATVCARRYRSVRKTSVEKIAVPRKTKTRFCFGLQAAARLVS